MKFFISVCVVFVCAFAVGNALAQTSEMEDNNDWMSVDLSDQSDPAATQSVTNQALLYGLQEVTVHLQHLENKCTSPDSADCSAAIIAAEQKAEQVAKDSGLSKKARHQVKKMIEDAILAANIGDVAGVKEIRDQIADHEKRLTGVEGDVKVLKKEQKVLRDDVDALKKGGAVVVTGTPAPMDGQAVVGYTQAQRDAIVAKATADDAKRVAEEAKVAAEEAKAAAAFKSEQQGGVSQEALTAALDQVAQAQAAAELAERKAEEAKQRADEVAAKSGTTGDPAADAEAKRLAEEAKTVSADALDKAQQALATTQGLQSQIDELKGEVAEIKASLDKKQDANEISVGLGYFSTPKIFSAPTVVLKAALKRGDVLLGIGAEMGYHFFYGDVYFEPEVRILMNYNLGVSYQFVHLFSAGLGVFSYSAGQAYSDTFGFGIEAHTRFSWDIVPEKVGMSVELWGGPCYNWWKENLPEPEGTLTTEVYRSTRTNSEINGAFGLRLTVDI